MQKTSLSHTRLGTVQQGPGGPLTTPGRPVTRYQVHLSFTPSHKVHQVSDLQTTQPCQTRQPLQQHEGPALVVQSVEHGAGHGDQHFTCKPHIKAPLCAGPQQPQIEGPPFESSSIPYICPTGPTATTDQSRMLVPIRRYVAMQPPHQWAS